MPGSNLSLAYTNFLQSGANRRFLVNTADGRADAITTVLHLGGPAGGNPVGGALAYAHPDSAAFEAVLNVNRITATAIGPSRWEVNVEYVANQFTGFPGTGESTLLNAKVAYEGVQVYCDHETFKDGLPWGVGGSTFLSTRGDRMALSARLSPYGVKPLFVLSKATI